MEKQKQSAQNSPLRKYTEPIVRTVAKGLIKVFPTITPNNVTDIGTGLVAMGGLAATIPHEGFTPWAIGLMAAGTIADAFDGAVAREQGSASVQGALHDTLSDRLQESALAGARIVQASGRKDVAGVAAAALAGITNPIPSYLRARVEKMGYVVPESGTGFLGTRPARAISGIVATAEQSTQPILDSITVLSNITASIERALLLSKAQKGTLEQNTEEDYKLLGGLKSKMLLKYIAINTASMLAAGTIGIVNSLT